MLPSIIAIRRRIESDKPDMLFEEHGPRDDAVGAWRRTRALEQIVADYHRSAAMETTAWRRTALAWVVECLGFVLFTIAVMGLSDSSFLDWLLIVVAVLMISTSLTVLGAARGQRMVLRRWRRSLERAGLDLTPPDDAQESLREERE